MQIYWKKQAFIIEEKSSTPTGFVWNTNKAAISLFWVTNMAAVISFETLYNRIVHNTSDWLAECELASIKWKKEWGNPSKRGKQL